MKAAWTVSKRQRVRASAIKKEREKGEGRGERKGRKEGRRNLYGVGGTGIRPVPNACWYFSEDKA